MINIECHHAWAVQPVQCIPEAIHVNEARRLPQKVFADDLSKIEGGAG